MGSSQRREIPTGTKVGISHPGSGRDQGQGQVTGTGARTGGGREPEGPEKPDLFLQYILLHLLLRTTVP